MLIYGLCLGFRDLPAFLDCVKEGNVELVEEHISRGEQVGEDKLAPRFSPLPQDASDDFFNLNGNNSLPGQNWTSLCL